MFDRRAGSAKNSLSLGLSNELNPGANLADERSRSSGKVKAEVKVEEVELMDA
jgi:hypothetical protein